MKSTEEKLRKLTPIDESTDMLWKLFLSGEGEERERYEELIDILLY